MYHLPPASEQVPIPDGPVAIVMREARLELLSKLYLNGKFVGLAANLDLLSSLGYIPRLAFCCCGTHAEPRPRK